MLLNLMFHYEKILPHLAGRKASQGDAESAEERLSNGTVVHYLVTVIATSLSLIYLKNNRCQQMTGYLKRTCFLFTVFTEENLYHRILKSIYMHMKA